VDTSRMEDHVVRLTVGWIEVERTHQGDMRVSHAPLLRQLADAAAHSGGKGEGGGRAVYESRPPLTEEPWHVLMEIERAALAMAAAAGANRPAELPRVIRNLALWGAGRGAAAEVALGYKRRLRLLQAPCPLCDERHCLRVWLDDFGPDRAACGACRAEWDRDTMGLLAGALLDGAGH